MGSSEQTKTPDWVHISYNPGEKQRNQILVAYKDSKNRTRYKQWKKKINQLLEGQAVITTKLEEISKQKNDHENRIRSLEKKFWTSLAIFGASLATFIEGLIGK